MKRVILLSLVGVSMMSAGVANVPIEITPENQNVSDVGIFNNTKFTGELRPRYENADDSINDTANAATMRFSLSASTELGAIEGLSAYGQILAVTNFGYDEYAPEQTGYAVIADPQSERVTQAYLDYKTGDTLFRLGRQIVNLDDERFVGVVDWRQMPQTFMGYTVSNNSIENLGLLASYVTDRYGVTDASSEGTETVLLHADYKVMEQLKITGYGYLIGSSSNTYGLMATGKASIINYIAEVAIQQDASIEYQTIGKPSVDAMYYRLDASTMYGGFVFGVAFESLGEADGNSHGFTTPLATLHKWQGFADVFLGYTAGSSAFGLNDAYAKIGYVSKEYGKVFGFYHDFSAKETLLGSTDSAGSEFDLLYSFDFSEKLNATAKAAFFAGDANSVINAAKNDVTRYWVQLDYKF